MPFASPRWSYVLLYNDGFGTRDQVMAMLDSHPQVLNWYTCLPHAFFLVSGMTAEGLATSFRRLRGEQAGMFLIVDANTDKNGWLPQDGWDILNTPAPAARR